MPDRKPIGTCYHCGGVAYKRIDIPLKVAEGRTEEVRVKVCYAHYSKYLRDQKRGRKPGSYTHPRKHTWDEEMYDKLLRMYDIAGMTQAEIARALEISRPQVSIYLKRARKAREQA